MIRIIANQRTEFPRQWRETFRCRHRRPHRWEEAQWARIRAISKKLAADFTRQHFREK